MCYNGAVKKVNIKNLFKVTSLCLFWLFVGILIGIFVLSYVQGWFNQLINDLSFATGMMAIGTFFLAFITYWSIHSRNAQEQRDRKERYLNEILGWLREIDDRLFAVPELDIYKQIQEDKSLATKIGVTTAVIDRNRQLRVNITNLDILKREIRNAQYFEKLAVRLNTVFSELIKNILNLLKQREQLMRDSAMKSVDSPPVTEEIVLEEIKSGLPSLLTELIKADTKPLDGLNLREDNINTVLMGRNAKAIIESTNKTIDKAIELKYII